MLENIFYVVNDHFCSLRRLLKTREENVDLGDGVRRDREEVARLVYQSVLATLVSLERLGLTYLSLSPDTILLSQGQIFLQNQLLVKSSQGKAGHRRKKPY